MTKTQVFCALIGATFLWGAAPVFSAESSGKDDSGAVSQISSEFGGEVIVKGKGIEIRQGELDDVYIRYSMSLASQGRSIPSAEVKKIEKEILDQLIVRKVVFLKASKEDRKDAKAEAAKEIEKEIKKEGSEDLLRRRLISEGWTYNDFVKHQEETSLCKLFLKKYMKVEISDDDAKKFYTENQKYFIAPEMFMGGYIWLINRDLKTGNLLPDEDIAKKKKLAEEALEKIKKGEDFDTIMKNYSEDYRTRSRGSTIVFVRKQMPKEFEDVAFALKSGEVSDVVTSDAGYFIIKVVKRTDEGLIPFAEIKEKLKMQLTDEKMREKLPEVTEKFKQEYEVQILR